MPLINKSLVHLVLFRLYNFFSAPWNFIRLKLFKLCCRVYGGGENIPRHLMRVLMPLRKPTSNCELNALLIAPALEEIARVVGKEPTEFTLWRMYMALVVHPQVVSNRDYDRFDKLLAVEPSEFHDAVWAYCFEYGDIANRRHQWRMEYDGVYRQSVYDMAKERRATKQTDEVIRR